MAESISTHFLEKAILQLETGIQEKVYFIPVGMFGKYFEMRAIKPVMLTMKKKLKKFFL